MEIKYAWSPAVKGEYEYWTLRPWRLKGLKIFDLLEDIPEDHILVVSHFAPWWSPLKEWVEAGRPWIEIDFGYWGEDTPRRATRRVTYCGHHNMNMRTRPWPRTQLFQKPEQQEWKYTPGDYVLVPMPVNEILIQRRGMVMEEWCEEIETKIKKYWDGPIMWRKKAGDKSLRFQNFQNQMTRAHAVVGERTMACAEAVLSGVPAYTVDLSITTLLMGGLENLTDIQYPDRTDWWDHIAWSQFHVWEFTDCEESVADLVEAYQICK